MIIYSRKLFDLPKTGTTPQGVREMEINFKKATTLELLLRGLLLHRCVIALRLLRKFMGQTLCIGLLHAFHPANMSLYHKPVDNSNL